MNSNICGVRTTTDNNRDRTAFFDLHDDLRT
jgi:hypothetical protein